MPFGLTTAFFALMTLMDNVIQLCLGKFVVTLLYENTIYSVTQIEHIQNLKVIFPLFRENKLFAKENKCEFLKTDIHRLGHDISSKGVVMDRLSHLRELLWT